MPLDGGCSASTTCPSISNGRVTSSARSASVSPGELGPSSCAIGMFGNAGDTNRLISPAYTWFR